jgi:hypothetical protein
MALRPPLHSQVHYRDIPVKKKTASEKAEEEQSLAIRKEAGLKIDPKTAEVDWSYGLDLDPYGICDEWELPEEFDQVGHQRSACSPQSDIWVPFSDLPDTVREELWARQKGRTVLASLRRVRRILSGRADRPEPRGRSCAGSGN